MEKNISCLPYGSPSWAKVQACPTELVEYGARRPSGSARSAASVTIRCAMATLRLYA